MKHTFNLAKKIRASESKERKKKDKAGQHGQRQRRSLEMGGAVETFVRKYCSVVFRYLCHSARNVTILLGKYFPEEW